MSVKALSKYFEMNTTKNFQYDEFTAEIYDMCCEKMAELEQLWTQMGVDRAQRMSTVKNYLLQSCERMITEEKGHLDQILKQIQMLEQERQGLLKELNQPDEINDRYDNLPYVAMVQDLEEMNNGLKTIKEARMVEVNSLRKTDEDASNEVGEPSYPIPLKLIPSLKQMNELKSHIKEMQTLKIDRAQKFESIKSQILELYEELQTEPNSTLERRLICGQNDEVSLSSANLNMMEKMLWKLQNNLEDNKIKIKQSMERIEVLCSRLNLDEIERKKYILNNFSGFSGQVVKEVSFKLEELEKKKLASLSLFVREARKEISDIWDKCLYSKEQKKEFKPMYLKDASEDMLNDHEKEIERLKSYFEENAIIFSKIEEWSRIWVKKVELDNKAKDPNRLFNRRKNNLAEEEVERNRIKRQLPKLESELFEIVEEHDQREEKIFTIYGVPFAQYIEDKKSEQGEETEFEKFQKKNMRKKLTEHETIYGSTPRKPLTPMNVTTTLAKSRHLEAPSNRPGSTMKKSASAESQRTVLKRPAMPRNTNNIQSSQKIPFANKRMVPGNQQMGGNPKKRRLNDNSIISGNLQSTITSINSTINAVNAKDGPSSSSTFSLEPKSHHTRSANRPPTPQSKISTPIRGAYKTRDTPTFKTPSSIPRFTSGKAEKVNAGTLKSGRKVPFKI